MVKITPAESEFMGFGTWLKTARGIYLCCPSCGNISALTEYAINEDGLVSPAVICPNGFCKFNEDVQLQDWTPEVSPE